MNIPLQHYGIKGMHWGVRRDHPGADGSSVPVQVHTRPGQMVKAEGGRNHPPHEDAVRVAVARQKAKHSTTDSLSTKELQELVNRMNLERQYSQITAGDPRNQSDAQRILKTIGKTAKTAQAVYQFANSPAGKALRTAIKARGK